MAVFIVDAIDDTVDAGDHKLSLREAVALANDGMGADTIGFALGLEGRTLTLTGGELALRQDVTIDGDRDGNGKGVALSGGDVQRIMSTSGDGTDVTLKGLTLTHGYAYYDGGAILAVGRRLLLDGCTVTNSSSYTGRGGGIASYGELIVENSTINNNRANIFEYGGGIAGGGHVVILDSVLSNNDAYKGGAIHLAYGSSLSVVGSAIVGNHAGSEGGGIFAEESNVLIEGSIVDSNSVGGEDNAHGGGIFVLDSTLNVVRSTISNNHAEYDGGGIIAFSSDVSILASTFSGNDAELCGGALFGAGGRIDLRSSTITNNSASAEYFANYQSSGGGIAVSDGYFATHLTISDSIVAGNRVAGVDPTHPAEDADVAGDIDYSNGHNLFGSAVEGAAAGDVQDVDPLLLFAALDPITGGGSLDDHGGPTPTVALWDDPFNPALGGAGPTVAGSLDQRGVVRPPWGDADVGAFELTQSFDEPAGRLFDGLEYIATYADLIRALGPNEAAGTSHYQFYGSDEGRGITFDGLEYVASHADLIAAFGADREAGARHFIEFGLDESRPLDEFDAEQYLANHADLQAAFGSDTEAATIHFIRYGHGEGRTDAALDLLL